MHRIATALNGDGREFTGPFLRCSIILGTPAELPPEEFVPSDFLKLKDLMNDGLDENSEAASIIVFRYLFASFLPYEIENVERILSRPADEIDSVLTLLNGCHYYSDSLVPAISVTAFFPILLARGVVNVDDEDLSMNHGIQLSDGLAFSWYFENVDADMGLYSHEGVSIDLAPALLRRE
jgi:hypothetical protein|tara:strand:- start:171 stop:710 length:540 start_codon:yes stop_codon:yes gene_type:complete